MTQTMKKILFQSVILLSLVTMVSCAKEQLDTTPSAPHTAGLRNNCTECVEVPYTNSDSKTLVWGNGSHSKTVSYVAYNTEDAFVVEVYYSRNSGNAADLIEVTVDGVSHEAAPVASGSTTIFSFPLPAGWSACDPVHFTVYQEGQGSPVNFANIYELREYCGCDYESNLLAGAGSCNGTQRSATFTFTSEDGVSDYKIQGALTAKSSDVSVEVSSGTYNIRTVGNGDNFIISAEGGLAACGEVTVTISWTSTNGGSEITGTWCVKDLNGNELAPEIGPLSCQ
jgi:hypothetical protein